MSTQASTMGTFTPIASTLGAEVIPVTVPKYNPYSRPSGPLFVSIPNYGSYQLYSTGPFNNVVPTPFSTLASTIGPNITGTNPWGA